MTSLTFKQRLNREFPECPVCKQHMRNLYMHLLRHLQLNEISLEKVNETLRGKKK